MIRLDGPEEGRRWVFLHGLMGFHHNWRRIVAGLESSERCLSYDQRGHGRSFQPPEGYRPEDYADDLKAILDELGWKRVVLVGHSMGGRNAINFAARWPERVETLVVEDIGPESAPGGEKSYRDLLGSVPAPFADRAQARAFFSDEFPRLHSQRENPGRLAEYFYANMEEKPEGSFSWRFSVDGVLASVRAGEEQDRWDEWADLKVKTLVVRGENSKELNAGTLDRMLRSNKLAHSITIPSAGHWVHADQPEAFLQALRQWTGLSE